jgi:hypothetical protein
MSAVVGTACKLGVASTSQPAIRYAGC